MSEICVVGAGVIGLSTAVNVIENVSGVSVTLISEKFSPDTTGDIAAGFWTPHKLQDTDPHLIRKWGGITLDHLMKLYKSAEASDFGVLTTSGHWLQSYPRPVPEFFDMYPFFREMEQAEIQKLYGYGIQQGWALTTLMVECWKYLPRLLQIFKEKRGKVVQRKVESLSELYDDYDVVVNCTGFGAKELLNDPDLWPARGQAMRVAAPWINTFVVLDNFHILVGARDLIVGGTFQEGNSSLETNDYDTQRIWQQCCSLVPSLQKGEILKHRVGIRPVRKTVRLEKETVAHRNKTIQVIHNYGHSGSGITLHWGCAKEATQLVQEALGQLRSTTTSKL